MLGVDVNEGGGGVLDLGGLGCTSVSGFSVRTVSFCFFVFLWKGFGIGVVGILGGRRKGRVWDDGGREEALTYAFALHWSAAVHHESFERKTDLFRRLL